MGALCSHVAPRIQPRQFFLEATDFLHGPMAFLKQFARRPVTRVYPQSIKHGVWQGEITPIAESRTSFANREA